MIEDKYIITENQLCKLTHGMDDTLECRELIVKICANTLSEHDKQMKNDVLDRVIKEIFKLSGEIWHSYIIIQRIVIFRLWGLMNWHTL